MTCNSRVRNESSSQHPETRVISCVSSILLYVEVIDQESAQPISSSWSSESERAFYCWWWWILKDGRYSHSAKGNRIRPDFYHRQQQTVLGRQDSPCSWFPFQIPVLIPVPVRQPGLEFQSRGIFAAGWAMVGRCRLINRCISLKSDPTVLCLLIPLTGARGHSDWCLLGGFTFEGWSTTVIITGHQSSNADAFSRIMVYLEGWTALLVPLNSFADAPITNGWSLTGTVQDAVFMS